MAIKISNLFSVPALLLIIALSVPMHMAQAQTSQNQVGAASPINPVVTPLPVNVSIAQLEGDVESLKDAELDDAVRASIDESLRRAIARLENAQEFEIRALGYQQNTDNHAMIIEGLEKQFDSALAQLEAPVAELEMEVTSDSLTVMERDLRALEADSDTLETQIEVTQQRLTILAGREQIARAEKTSSETALSEINAQVAALSGSLLTLPRPLIARRSMRGVMRVSVSVLR